MNLRFAQSMEQKAIEYFGTTTDYREAGYILANGTMLDFSGKSEGGTPGQRSYDHRELGFIDDLGGGGDAYTGSGWEKVAAFMALGHMRFSFHSGDVINIGIVVDPTYPQRRRVTEIIRDAQEMGNGVDIYLDIFSADGGRTESRDLQHSFYPQEWTTLLEEEEEDYGEEEEE